uniref:C2 domain-containing protein n=1 Tax=Ciona savignyi TaxID=51511 RepID=H2Z8S3_CIOSA
MGEHVINVSELDCSDVITNKWLSLHPETDFSISGKIKISMTYQSPQSLFIAVNDVTELRCKSQKPYRSIRVYIPGVPYVFETKPASDVKMGDDVSADDVVSCEWKESFEFPVAKEELSSRYVVIVAHDVTNEYLGECHIDLDNFDCDVGYSGPFRLSDMRGNAMVRSRWSRNAVSSEFQDALLAHAQYKKPNFVFSRAGTNKAVSLRVPKAGAESRIRVVNGILVH